MLPFQRNDFAGLFKAMAGRPVTIRLLDPPLHEFLPQDKAGQEEMAKVLGKSAEDDRPPRARSCTNRTRCSATAAAGWASSIPEITAMQARAIFEAAVQVQEGGRRRSMPEVMIPLVGFKKELHNQEKIVRDMAAKVFAETGTKVEYLVGTMIEVPRACVTADEIAETAEFFSFGTNDLTQTTLGMSRDDYGPFISAYTDPKKADVLHADPFATIDQDGVGALMKMGVEKGRGDAAGPEDRHLRRARRRPGQRQVLPQDRAELRELQPVPRADRPAGGGAGGAGEVIPRPQAQTARR